MDQPIDATEPLPFWQLQALPFQRFCRDVLRQLPGVQSSRIYGSSGQAQRGIDIIVETASGERWAGQCKAHQTFDEHSLKTTLDEFDKHVDYWIGQGLKRLILMIGCGVDRRQVSDSLAAYHSKLLQSRIHLDLWDSHEIEHQVRPFPEVVRCNLPPFCVERICSAVGDRRRSIRFQNLPSLPLIDRLIGRAELLKDLASSLVKATDRESYAESSSPSVMVVSGTGGVGKTVVAIELAWKEYAEGSVAIAMFIPSSDPDAIAEKIGAFTEANFLDLPEKTEKKLDVRVGAVIRAIENLPKEKGALIIFDGVDNERSRKRVHDLIPQLAASRANVLIASRLAQWSDDVAIYDLDVFTPLEARSFLVDRLHGGSTEVASDDERILDDLAEELGRLPLALELAVAYIRIRRRSPTEVVDEWRMKLVDFQHSSVNYSKPLAFVWDASVRKLDEAARCLLRILAWLDGDKCPMKLLESLEVDFDVSAAIAELEQFCLLKWAADGTHVSIHSLIQEITRSAMTPEERIDSHGTAVEAVSRLFGSVGESDSRSVSVRRIEDGIFANIVAVIRLGEKASESLMTKRALFLKSILGLHFRENWLLPQAERELTKVLEIVVENFGADLVLLASAHHNLGELLDESGRPHEATSHLGKAVEALEGCSDELAPMLAATLDIYGLNLARTDPIKAEKAVRRAIKIHRKHSPPGELAISLGYLGLILRQQARHEEAEGVLSESLTFYEDELGKNHEFISSALNNLALVFSENGKEEKTRDLFERALKIDRAAYEEPHDQLAKTLSNYGMHLLRTSPDEARQMLEEALEINASILPANHPEIGKRQVEIAITYFVQERYKSALPWIEKGVSNLNHYLTVTGVRHPDYDPAIELLVRTMEQLKFSRAQIEERLKLL